jgi:hypothetical protein
MQMIRGDKCHDEEKSREIQNQAFRQKKGGKAPAEKSRKALQA